METLSCSHVSSCMNHSSMERVALPCQTYAQLIHEPAQARPLRSSPVVIDHGGDPLIQGSPRHCISTRDCQRCAKKPDLEDPPTGHDLVWVAGQTWISGLDDSVAADSRRDQSPLIAHQLPGYHGSQNLVCSFTYRHEWRVPVKALHLVLGRIPVSAVDAHRLECRFDAYL